MKRTLSKKVSGKKGDREWFMLVFDVEFADGKLYAERTMFVPKAVYDALNEGDVVDIKG